MSAREFPRGFRWGATTSAYQVEGAHRSGGRAESIWDRFCRQPGAVRGDARGDRASDSYHRFAEDVALLARMNLSSYRFSIAWPRILADGDGAPLADGLVYYERLVDSLLEAGIRPLPTLYHWDLPQRLEERGGWPLRDTAGRFSDYADTVARALADRVEDWLLFAEPMRFTQLGYLTGVHAPGRRSRDDFLRATHTVNLAQAGGFRAIRANRSDARIGTALGMTPCEPAGDTDGDAEAAERWHRFHNLWFAEPARTGRYPDALLGGVPARTMGIRPEDPEQLQVPLDFLGVDVYARTVVAADDGDALGLGGRAAFGVGGRVGPRTDFGWEVWPDAMYDMLARLDADLEHPALEVTGSGCAYGNGPDERGDIRDDRRIAYHHGQLDAVHRALDSGVDVRSYHVVSLIDGFEWSAGFSQRFGLAWVDFETGERTLKSSGDWYGRVAADGILPEDPDDSER